MVTIQTLIADASDSIRIPTHEEVCAELRAALLALIAETEAANGEA